jgi:hypothetical protein
MAAIVTVTTETAAVPVAVVAVAQRVPPRHGRRTCGAPIFSFHQLLLLLFLILLLLLMLLFLMLLLPA